MGCMPILTNYKGKMGIYAIFNLVNNHQYIGSSVNVGSRLKDHQRHLREGTHFNPHLQAAWNKYGEENFWLYLVLATKDKNELFQDEQLFLDIFGKELLYNVNFKAGKPPELTIQQRQEMAKKMNQTLAAKRQAAIERGEPDSWLSKETRERLGASQRGIKRSEEFKQNISDKKRGRKRPPFSAEWRCKLSEANHRRVWPDEVKKRISESNRKTKMAQSLHIGRS
jgi:group I intron endonuclease